MRKSKIEDVLRKHNGKLMSTSGVAGTAIGKYRGKPCITVFVRSHDPAILQEIPSTLDGYKVRVVEAGEFRALEG